MTTITPKPEHIAAMMRANYAAADCLGKEISKLSDRQLHGPKHKRLTARCVSYLDAAEQCRAALQKVTP